jgi:hypothetical protein
LLALAITALRGLQAGCGVVVLFFLLRQSFWKLTGRSLQVEALLACVIGQAELVWLDKMQGTFPTPAALSWGGQFLMEDYQ